MALVIAANLPSPPGSSGAKEVADYIFSEVLGSCPEYPAAVSLSDVVDERGDVVTWMEHTTV